MPDYTLSSSINSVKSVPTRTGCCAARELTWCCCRCCCNCWSVSDCAAPPAVIPDCETDCDNACWYSCTAGWEIRVTGVLVWLPDWLTYNRIWDQCHWIAFLAYRLVHLQQNRRSVSLVTDWFNCNRIGNQCHWRACLITRLVHLH